ncbi:serine/threonine-protein kinase Chk1-like [Oreochromis aureus]|uniref:serine/threonine-protein kinase Chk1-like n=1 Tax=Oreochromis aureus TaxID=47969 RepID=UPI0019534922|nr:serine/threonine-protein kinase Chk1-like [Oreochromis aureus]
MMMAAAAVLLCSPWQRLVRRMTRFFTTVSADDSLTALKDICEGLALGFKLTSTKQGDGLEFKRLFVKIKHKLGDIISTQKILVPI